MKKRLLAGLLAFVMVFGVAPLNFVVSVSAADASGVCGEDLKWSYDSKTYTLTIYGTGPMANWSPWEDYHGLIKHIIIRNGATSIGDEAFRNFYNLLDISIPSSVKSIGYWALYWCHNLKTVTIPNGVTSIGQGAFRECISLTSIVIPESVKSIGYSLFRDCTSLASITVSENNSFYHSSGDCLIETASKTLIAGCKNSVIPDDGSVTSIQYYALCGITGLTDLTIPESIISIGYSAFEGCTGLKRLTYNAVDCTLLKDSTNAGKNWLYGASEIEYVTIGNSVSKIPESFFTVNSKVANITIPDSVTSIGNGAFSGCTGLTSMTIPDSVTSIGAGAFGNCTGLTSVTIPDSVTSIGGSAFAGCTGLTSITIPDSVTSIGSSAFYKCTKLTSVTIPNSVTIIDGAMFSSCSSLKSVTIPNSITSIGYNAFYDTRLTDVYFYGTYNEWENISIDSSNTSWLIRAKKHYSTIVTMQPATCVEDGYEAYSYWSATDPVEYITEPVIIPATGHTPAKAVKENLVPATAESTGSYDSVVYCSVCGEELSRKTTVIPKTAQNAEIFTFTADKTEAVRGSTVTFTVVASSDINMIRLVDVIDGDENNPVGMGFSKASVGSGFTDNGDGTAVWIIPLTVSLSDYTNENEANEYTLYYYDASVFSYNAADIESVYVNVTKYDNSAAVNEVGGEAVEPFSIINATADSGKKLTYTNITITTTIDVTKLRLTVDGKAVTYSAKTSNVTYTDNGDGTATWVIGYRFTKAGNYEILVESRGSSWEGCSSKTVATTIYNTAAELAAAKS